MKITVKEVTYLYLVTTINIFKVTVYTKYEIVKSNI
jgi:hypothetical protein